MDNSGTLISNPVESKPRNLQLVLVTPAHNEATFIERTLISVIHQNVTPIKWVVVSDGSTDETNQILQRYENEHDWIECIKLPPRSERHFAGKVHAFNIGFDRVRHLDFDIVGNLDADISFDDPDYFAYLLDRFVEDPQLGVAGTPYREGGIQYDYRFSRKEHVSGACQLFRRECFESIGGYVPLKVGGIDLVAVVTARMKGWTTQTFTAKFCMHHRRMGSAKSNIITATFKGGYHDYLMGVHPAWQLCRCLYQTTRKPIILGGVLLLVGYAWAMLTRAEQPVSVEFVRFRRMEQTRWLHDFMKRALSPLQFCGHR